MIKKNKSIILSNTIQKDLKIDTANHAAYATYATTYNNSQNI